MSQTDACPAGVWVMRSSLTGGQTNFDLIVFLVLPMSVLNSLNERFRLQVDPGSKVNQ